MFTLKGLWHWTVYSEKSFPEPLPFILQRRRQTSKHCLFYHYLFVVLWGHLCKLKGRWERDLGSCQPSSCSFSCLKKMPRDCFCGGSFVMARLGVRVGVHCPPRTGDVRLSMKLQRMPVSAPPSLERITQHLNSCLPFCCTFLGSLWWAVKGWGPNPPTQISKTFAPLALGFIIYKTEIMTIIPTFWLSNAD